MGRFPYNWYIPRGPIPKKMPSSMGFFRSQYLHKRCSNQPNGRVLYAHFYEEPHYVYLAKSPYTPEGLLSQRLISGSYPP